MKKSKESHNYLGKGKKFDEKFTAVLKPSCCQAVWNWSHNPILSGLCLRKTENIKRLWLPLPRLPCAFHHVLAWREAVLCCSSASEMCRTHTASFSPGMSVNNSLSSTALSLSCLSQVKTVSDQKFSLNYPHTFLLHPEELKNYEITINQQCYKNMKTIKCYTHHFPSQP